ncbi:MAG TPA: hypothetical protein VD794_05320 [Flavisolibacter sp.]|nr:hypothetical protein [Flavisolibacter sp.]
MTIKKLHYVSGLTLSIFIGLHLFNHFYSVFGADRHIEVMNTLRPIYRNLFAEAILLSAVGIQIVSGLRLVRTSRNTAMTNVEMLHTLSGLYLAIFLIIHVGAVLSGRLFLKLDTNFYFGVAGLNTFPFSLFFIPYYGLAIFAFFGHVAAIHHKKRKQDILGITPGGQASAILVIGLLITIVLFYGLTNHFKGVEIPKQYEVLIGK